MDQIRVLFVDDDVDAREAMGIYLKFFGAEVLCVDSASKALKNLLVFQPHIIVSDIAMPHEDGYSLIRRIRKLDSKECNIPAIALTAFASADDSRKALAAGFQFHLAKPIEANELAETIAKFAQIGI